MRHVELLPNMHRRPKWTSVSLNFDPTQFSVLSGFEQALTQLVGDAIYQLRPESTMNAAIVMLAAPLNSPRNGRRAGYAYRWYRMGRVGPPGAAMQRHMRYPILFDEAGLGPTDATVAIENRRPFVFDQPVTLASAFLHHELQRRPDTKSLLGPVDFQNDREADRLREHWANLDDDKNDTDGTCYIIHNPGARYPKLHRETFQRNEAARGTVATFIKPLIVREVLLGLFCVDVAGGPVAEKVATAGAEPESSVWLEQFTRGLVSLGVGIEAALGACSKAYYTHLDPAPVRRNGTRPKPEAPILSAAFLETLMAEVEHRTIAALTTCAMAYLFFDNNDLKRINTIGNYECGTEIIRATGQWITDGLRAWAETYIDKEEGLVNDRLEHAPQFWVVRWGGDEFIAVVAGGTGAESDWEALLNSINEQIQNGREALADQVASLRSLKAKRKKDIEELKNILRDTSVSVGAVFVERVSAKKDKSKRFDGTLPVFLRQARVVAEDRMKLVKNMSKIDQTLRKLVEKGQSPNLTIESLRGGLRWCYGDLSKEDLAGEV